MYLWVPFFKSAINNGVQFCPGTFGHDNKGIQDAVGMHILPEGLLIPASLPAVCHFGQTRHSIQFHQTQTIKCGQIALQGGDVCPMQTVPGAYGAVLFGEVWRDA
jgi:hypothetical protein